MTRTSAASTLCTSASAAPLGQHAGAELRDSSVLLGSPCSTRQKVGASTTETSLPARVSASTQSGDRARLTVSHLQCQVRCTMTSREVSLCIGCTARPCLLQDVHQSTEVQSRGAARALT